MKKLITVLMIALLCMSLCACGNPKEAAMKHLPDSPTAAFMLKFDKNYDFDGSCDEVPNSGIIVLYQGYNNTYIVICNSNGKEIRTMDINTISKHALGSSGNAIIYQSELRFMEGCMDECLFATNEEPGGEVVKNQWYVFTADDWNTK